MDELLWQMWVSSKRLPGLFDLGHPPDKQRKFFNEEQHELQEASNELQNEEAVDWNRDGYQGAEVNRLRKEVALEAFDVMYTAMNILHAHGISYKDFTTACWDKLAVNDEKTPENGYGLVNGKVKKL